MATPLDLDEQEQLDQLKALWARYGNLITFTLVVALTAFAAWSGWQWWQRDQATKASVMYFEIDKAAQAGDADKAARVFADLKERFPRTVYAQQAGLLAAKVQFDKKQLEAASANLNWVSEHATEAEYRTLARLRLAGVLMDQKKFPEALEKLDAAQGKGNAKEFEPLVADRRGDVLLIQGKPDLAKLAYTQAWQAMDSKTEYRRLIEAKLDTLGASPVVDKEKEKTTAATAAASGASQ